MSRAPVETHRVGLSLGFLLMLSSGDALEGFGAATSRPSVPETRGLTLVPLDEALASQRMRA